MKQIFKFNIKFLVFIIGLSFIYHAKNDLYHSYKSYKWTETDGIILESFIVKDEKDKQLYTPLIKYEYHILGKTYLNSKIYFKKELHEFNKASTIVKKYPENKKCRIFYDPDNPSDSVLERGIKLKTVFKTLSGVFLTLFSFLMFKLRKPVRRLSFGVILLNSGFLLLVEQINKIFTGKMNLLSLKSVLFNVTGIFIVIGGYKLCKPVIINSVSQIKSWKKRKEKNVEDVR